MIRLGLETLELGRQEIDSIARNVIEKAKQGKDDQKQWQRSIPGTETIIEARSVPMPHGGFVIIEIDITERKRAEAHFKESRDLLTAMFESFPGGISVIAPDLTFAATNSAFYEMLRAQEAEFPVGSKYENIVRYLAESGWYGDGDIDDIDDIVRHRLDQTAAIEPEEIERTVPDGRTLEMRSFPMPDGSKIRTYIDVTARKQVETDLKESRDLLKATFDHFPGGIAVYDKDLNLAAANPTYYELNQMRPENHPIGSKLEDLIRSVYASLEIGKEDIDRIVRNVIEKTKKENDVERRWERPIPGTEKIIETRAFPMPGGGLVNMDIDITERKRFQEAIITAKEAAEQANRAKSGFLANMSHEIRTPLNGVLGMASVLMQSDLTPEQRDQVNTIVESGDTLLTLLNDILDLSKVEAGRLELDLVDFDLDDLVNAVTGLWQPQFEEKSVTFSASCDAMRFLHGDQLRIRQVLNNLINNAQKFTEVGSVKLSVSETILSGGEIELRFTILDTGIGIAPDALPKLFDKFSQADTSITRQYGGTGLGLAICHRVVELMGGEIGVDSTLGEGSAFWFTIRCQLGKRLLGGRVLEEEQVPRPFAGHQKIRILAAEDNLVNQKVIHAILESGGYDCDIVDNGLEALSAIMRAPYDLVLMDIQMPEMDGETATQKIRNLPGEIRNIPIIALTANAMEGHKERYLAAGMNGYVAKPIKSKELFEAIDECLEGEEEAVLPQNSFRA